MTGLVIAVLIGVIAGTYAVYKRRNSWKASDSSSGDGQTNVRLLAGPWSGQEVKVPGVPAADSEVSTADAGLVGDGVHHGHYKIVEVDGTARTATASWIPDGEDD